MTPEQFVEFLEAILADKKQAFVANMSNLKITSKTPHEWMDLFVRWNELSNEEDAKRYYPEYYE